MAYHKGRGILFGGVHDVEATEEGIESEFFDAFYAWNIERNRFFQLSLRKPRAGGKKQQNAQKNRNRGRADEEELLQNLARLEAKGRPSGAAITEMEIDSAGMDDVEEEFQPKQSLPVRFEMPHPRFNSQLTVQDDLLFIFGGTFERGDQEFTFDDMYCIDLTKMDGVKGVFYNEPERWNDAIEPESDEDEEMGEDEDEEESEEEGEEESVMDTASTAPTEMTEPMAVEPEAEQEQEPAVQDSRPHPRPFETLREFFTRTSTEWQDLVISNLKERVSSSEKSVKELRKDAFKLAEEKWWDCREEITALEEAQEEAGIGDVVSIAERSDVTTAGRRR
jgi:hypothetical protein